MIVRRALETDIADIVGIERESFVAPWSEQSFLYELTCPDSYLTVLQVGESVCGFGCMRLIFGGEAEIMNIAVRESARRGGAGEMLLRDMLAYAEENGTATVFLEVRDGNTPAQRLYEKLGFEPIGIRRGYYDDAEGGDAVVMKKELTRCEI